MMENFLRELLALGELELFQNKSSATRTRRAINGGLFHLVMNTHRNLVKCAYQGLFKTCKSGFLAFVVGKTSNLVFLLFFGSIVKHATKILDSFSIRFIRTV